jgi:hypothetical protein
MTEAETPFLTPIVERIAEVVRAELTPLRAEISRMRDYTVGHGSPLKERNLSLVRDHEMAALRERVEALQSTVDRLHLETLDLHIRLARLERGTP